MKEDLKWYQFGSACVAVAEQDLGAALNDCSAEEQDRFINALYSDYLACGSPPNQKQWLRPRLKKLILSVRRPPNWIEARSDWPWSQGVPMVFLGQLKVPTNKVSQQHAAPGNTLYVFGRKVSMLDGFRMEYRVIAQDVELRGLVALVDEQEIGVPGANVALVKKMKRRSTKGSK